MTATAFTLPISSAYYIPPHFTPFYMSFYFIEEGDHNSIDRELIK